MKKSGYPKMDEHIKLHLELIDKVTDFKERYDKGAIALTVSLSSFLKEWLINHITKTDKELALYLEK